MIISNVYLRQIPNKLIAQQQRIQQLRMSNPGIVQQQQHTQQPPHGKQPPRMLLQQIQAARKNISNSGKPNAQSSQQHTRQPASLQQQKLQSAQIQEQSQVPPPPPPYPGPPPPYPGNKATSSVQSSSEQVRHTC